MATSGKYTKRTWCGDQLVFEWYVSSQNGMNSTIKWTATYSCPGCSYVDFNGNNMYMEVSANEETKRLTLFTPSDAVTVWDDGSTSTGKIYSGPQYFELGTPPKSYPTSITKTGTFTVTRDLETNQTDFSLHFYGSTDAFYYYGVQRKWLETYFPAFAQSGYSGYSGNNTPNLGFIQDTVTTTTTYGSGAQVVSVSDFTDETSPVITYSYDRGTSVDSVVLQAGISFAGEKENPDIPYREISATGSSYTFNFTQEELDKLYTLLNDGTTATVRFYIKTTETIDGEVLYITNYLAKTFSFVNYTPLIKPTIVDVNPVTIALTGDANKLVKHMSKASYDMNIELRKGALEVIGCYIQNGDKIEEGFESGVFDYPSSNTFYFSATDNRGYTGTTMYSLSSFDGEFIEYVKPTAGIKSEPISGEGVLQFTVTGKYFDKYFSATNKNQMSIRYAVYPMYGTATWVDLGVITPTVDGSDYSYAITVNGLDYTKAHTVEVQVTDRLLTTSATITAVAKPVFYWNKDNFFFNVPVSINDRVVDYVEEQNTASAYYMNSSGQYSSAGLSWNYIKWASGLLECWCSVPLTTAVNTAWGNMYVAAAQYKTDLSYPVQPKETPLVLVTLGAGGTKGMLIADNSYAADNVSTGRYNIASPVAITSSATFRLNYYVRGKWK